MVRSAILFPQFGIKYNTFEMFSFLVKSVHLLRGIAVRACYLFGESHRTPFLKNAEFGKCSVWRHCVNLVKRLRLFEFVYCSFL